MYYKLCIMLTNTNCGSQNHSTTIAGSVHVVFKECSTHSIDPEGHSTAKAGSVHIESSK